MYKWLIFLSSSKIRIRRFKIRINRNFFSVNKKFNWLYSLFYMPNIIIYIYVYHHHHHVVLVARISLTLSRHFSLSFIASGRSSGLHPVSSHSCWMYVCASRPAFTQPCVGVHKSTSLMSSSLLLQQCPACLVRLYIYIYIYIFIFIYIYIYRKVTQ